VLTCQKRFGMYQNVKIRNIKKIVQGNGEVNILVLHQQKKNNWEAEYSIGKWSKGLRCHQLFGYKRYKPDINILLLLISTRHKSHIIEKLKIPEKFMQKLEKFGDYWFPIAQLCAQDTRAYDLLNHNPILLGLIVFNSFNINPLLLNDQNLLDYRQQQILKHLGARGIPSEIKWLRKCLQIKTKAFWLEEYLRILTTSTLFTIFQQEIARDEVFLIKLNQLEEISMVKILQYSVDKIFDENDDAVKADADIWNRNNKDPGYQAKYGNKKNFHLEVFIKLVKEHIDMGTVYGLNNQVIKSLSNANSVSSIKEHHRYLNDCLDKLNQNDLWSDDDAVLEEGGIKFDHPPIKGEENIIPIKNSRDLKAEGQWMHHCVGGYLYKVLKKECYVFRILKPERATIALTFDTNTAKIIDFKAHRNKKISIDTFNLCHQWLDSNGFALENKFQEFGNIA